MLSETFHKVAQSIKHAIGRTTRPLVLLADDDEDVCAVCSAALTRGGFSVDIARDGRQVLERLGSRRYTAVLLDLGLPYVHGATVLSVIRQKDPAILRRLIVITGMNEAGLADIQPQVNTVLRKPISVAAMLEAVRDCSAPDTMVLQRQAG